MDTDGLTDGIDEMNEIEGFGDKKSFLVTKEKKEDNSQMETNSFLERMNNNANGWLKDTKKKN
eukprot:CAMPEP_0116890030 /NCGR_PEP_ID=MMETSP0467-20121206/572_1 /TAXON_ID=283647 /ORGANISM="Mesodinium pulex, Strain SPMC105" /LENGTH=62 /DNA_ID=CAMNT_0004557389 /DNA_START=701 /DNA_END=889 /DNA_ORIENTATION=-